MGLSSFIKQLLETDSVFGVEAKKLTGINDGGPLFDINNAAGDYLNENSNFNLIHVVLSNAESSLDITPISKTSDDPDLIRLSFKNIVKSNIFYNLNFKPNVPVRLFILDILSTDDFALFASTQGYNEFVYEIRRIDISDITNPIVDLSISDKDGVDFSTLVPLTGLKPTQVVCDPRVFALINDGNIAKRGPQGSTIFNLDNFKKNDDVFGLSGIATKYAAHYHETLPYELISHVKDENGNRLVQSVRVTEAGTTETKIINRDANVVFSNSGDLVYTAPDVCD